MIDEWVDGLIKQQNDTKKQRFCNLQRVPEWTVQVPFLAVATGISAKVCAWHFGQLTRCNKFNNSHYKKSDYTNDQADQVNRINGAETVCAGRGRVNLWTRISASVRGKHAHARAKLMQGISVPECVRPIHTRILPEAKKSLFLDVIESCYELDFTRKQTAKNGGFVCRVLLNFWTIQRVKRVVFVSNACEFLQRVKQWAIIWIIKPKTRDVNSGLVVTKLLAGGSLSRLYVTL